MLSAAKLLSATLLLVALTDARAGPVATCEPIDARVRLEGPVLTIAQVEEIGIRYAARNPKAPQVPFAYGNDRWLQLKALYRPGDVIRAYAQSWKPGDRPFAEGYALIRGKCVLGIITTHLA